MDEIQRVLIKSGRKDLAQKYYDKVAVKKAEEPLPISFYDYDKIAKKIKESHLKPSGIMLNNKSISIFLDESNGDRWHLFVFKPEEIFLEQR